MKLVFLMCVVFVIGCKSQESAKLPAKVDCHVGNAVAATITSENQEVEVKPWWTTHTASCPKNMREVKPSDREVDKGVGSYKSIDEWLNWRVQHVTCVPDGL
jgi:hypothetical protein